MNTYDACNILGIQPGASKEDVLKAYRKLAKQKHPDKGGDEVEFKKINEAFDFIKNHGSAGSSSSNYNTQTVGDIFNDFFKVNFRGNGQSDVIDDIFDDDIFETRTYVNYNPSRTKNKQSGRYISKNISMKLAIEGGKLRVSGTCAKCKGTGEVVAGWDECSRCKCTGRVPASELAEGAGDDLVACPRCKGKGKVRDVKGCEDCNPDDFITIPKGCKNGQTLSKNKLIYIIKIDKDSRFKYDSRDNIISNISLPLLKALQGTMVEVDTVIGKKKLKVPEKSRNGERIFARGLGYSGADHVFVLDVQYPDDVSEIIEVLK